MARTKRQTVPEGDPLRAKLDQLAELAIDRVLAKGKDATSREIVDTLKTVADYRKSTGAGDEPAPTAWNRYQQAMNGSKESGDGSRH
jgi:hypothetical protein